MESAEGDDDDGPTSITYCKYRTTRSYLHWYHATNTQAWCFADDAKHKKLKFTSGVCGKIKTPHKYPGDKIHFMCETCAANSGLA